MKKWASAVLSVCVCAVTAAQAETFYLWSNGHNAPVWKDAEGNPATWVNGSDAVWKQTEGGNCNGITATMRSITMETAAFCPGFWMDNSTLTIGEGVKADCAALGRLSAPRLVASAGTALSADYPVTRIGGRSSDFVVNASERTITVVPNGFLMILK